MLDKFLIALAIMAKGMAGIFIVIGILTLIVMVMGKLLGKKSDAAEQTKQ